MNRIQKNKIVVIVGPTASGKSDLAVKLAKKFSARGGPAFGWNGVEIISADSRQVYKGLDIGTGKITKKEMQGVPHHLLDVASPKRVFTAAQYKRLAQKATEEIWGRGKLPILVGGTGFYVDALLGDTTIPEVPPNKKLRTSLGEHTVQELFKKLKKLDLRRAKNIDPKNRRRLIRAIEIATQLGKVPRIKKGKNKYEILKIGIKISDKILQKRILDRLLARLPVPKPGAKAGIKQGMIAEAKRLHEKGLSLRRMEELGLEYRYLARYLQRKLSREEMIEQLNTAIWQYAKRQKTWFKRDKGIRWFKPSEYKKMEKEIKKFLQ